ncbi:SDR family NAD(P)-dependent oxidoreductase [Phycisphaerales bacterium AB-hyl4]|uniref:SDR family NAD(P)-dependent oxidoreductase n=1 Tax=Natronomicrosphaera hydrolytica TaxID=3242702 RepID=A0ABV4U787_9BACT
MADDTGKVAIVTGASSGIGAETAVLLAEAGYHLALLARRADRLDQVALRIADEVPDAPGSVIALPTDVTDPQAITRAGEAVLERFGRVDALVNCAGNAPLLPIDKITPEIYRDTIDANLGATVLLTATLWPTFKKQRAAVVVNVSSMSSIDPFPGFAMYAAAKIGVNMFTQCTATEGAKLGIQAVAIAPGAVETPMLRQNFSEKVLPREATLDPVEIAEVIRDCILGRRDFKPGETIVVDGK